MTKTENIDNNLTEFRSTIFGLVYSITGLISAYIFYSGNDDVLFGVICGLPSVGIICGLPFIFTTIVSLLITKNKLTLKSATLFITLSYLGYLFVFFITYLSFFLSFIVGLVTAGLGSLIVFVLFDRYIKPISINNRAIFSIGLLSFLFQDAVLFLSKFSDFFNSHVIDTSNSTNHTFAATYFFWQLFVGLRLSKEF